MEISWLYCISPAINCHWRGFIAQCLGHQWIPATILDVFEVEPLWKRASCGVDRMSLFHLIWVVSGLTQGKDAPTVFLEIYELFVEGRELKHVVDWDTGYWRSTQNWSKFILVALISTSTHITWGKNQHSHATDVTSASALFTWGMNYTQQN